jgi:hypothetical protein
VIGMELKIYATNLAMKPKPPPRNKYYFIVLVEYIKDRK